MSAFKKIVCDFKDKNLLISSLKELGFIPEIHNSPVKLKGYQGDIRQEQAEIIVPKEQINKLLSAQHGSNDVGFIHDSVNDKYIMICSEYDIRMGVGDRIKQSYAKTAIEQALAKHKFNIVHSDKEHNQLRITASKII